MFVYNPYKNMKKILIVFVLSFILYSCQTVPEPKSKNDNSPCNDSLYVSLKRKKMDDMSDREYQYYLEYDKLCKGYSQSTVSKGVSTETVLGIVTAVLIVVGVTIIIVANNKK